MSAPPPRPVIEPSSPAAMPAPKMAAMDRSALDMTLRYPSLLVSSVSPTAPERVKVGAEAVVWNIRGPRSADMTMPTATTATAAYMAMWRPFRNTGVTLPTRVGSLTAASRSPFNPCAVSSEVTIVPQTPIPSELPALRTVATKPEAAP